MRALHAALGIQRTFAVFAEILQRAHAVRLDLGLGVHAGTVVIEPLGAKTRADAIAPSLPIYLAERLQGLATGAAIYVSEAVWHQAIGFFHFEDRGLCPLPEIIQPVRVHACTGVAQVTSRLEALLHRQRSPFLGREHAMEQLGTFWTRACRGQGQVVVFFGEAGVGKSRLAYEFQRTLHTGRTLHAQTLSYGQAMPYYAMIPLLRTLVGLTDHDLAPQQRQHLHACLAAAPPALVADEPLLAHLLGIPVAPDELPTCPPEELKQRLQALCLQVILQSTVEQPLCVLIEDLHWLDNSSHELLDLLVTSLARQPVLLLGTARPGFRETWSDRTYFHRLTVEPLSDAHTETFIHNAVRPYAASTALIALIRARAAGNPFFVEELLRTLQECEMLVLQDGVYSVPPHQHLDMPSSVQGVLAARIDRLPPEAKQLLQTAAVIGHEVPLPLLQEIAELPEADLHRDLAHLQAAEFLYETQLFPEREYTFTHALTHEVAYSSLLQERRRILHARIVTAVETYVGNRVAEEVERLAHHALRGEVWDKALVYCRQAGRKAVTHSSLREALVYFEQALAALNALPDSLQQREQAVDLRLEMRNILIALGEFRAMFDYLRDAEILAKTLDDQRRLGWVSAYLSPYFHNTGNQDRAVETGHRALAIAQAAEDFALEVMATFFLGLAYIALGEYRQAADYHRRDVALLTPEWHHERFGESGLPAVFARVYLILSLVELGEFAEGRARGAEAMQIAEMVDQPFTLGHACWGVGLLSLHQGDLRQATAVLKRGLEVCQAGDIGLLLPWVASALGYAYLLAGRLPEALPLLQQAVEQDATQAYYPLWLTHLSEVYLRAGRLEEAQQLAQRALELSRALKQRGHEVYALRLLAEIVAHGHPGEGEHAEAYYREALSLADTLGMRPLQAHCHFGLGTLYGRMGRRDPAQAALSAAIVLYRTLDMFFWLPQAEAALKRMT
jgi:predicted ATPase